MITAYFEGQAFTGNTLLATRSSVPATVVAASYVIIFKKRTSVILQINLTSEKEQLALREVIHENSHMVSGYVDYAFKVLN